MKTKGLIYILAVLFIFTWSACEDDNPMPKFEGDSASFMIDEEFISVKSDFTYLELFVFHKSINKKGSKVEIEVIPAEGTPAGLATLDKTVLNFDEADTLSVKLSIDYASLGEDVPYSITLKFSDKYIGTSWDGVGEVTIDFIKWRPRRMSDFVGSFTVDAVSNLSPGSWDEEWDVTTVADGTDNTKLLITGISGSDVAVEAFLDFTEMTITIPAGQGIGDPYDYGTTSIYNFDGVDITTDDLVGTLKEDNSFSFDYMTIWLNDYADVWDIFTPTFTKN